MQTRNDSGKINYSFLTLMEDCPLSYHYVTRKTAMTRETGVCGREVNDYSTTDEHNGMHTFERSCTEMCLISISWLRMKFQGNFPNGIGVYRMYMIYVRMCCVVSDFRMCCVVCDFRVCPVQIPEALFRDCTLTYARSLLFPTCLLFIVLP